MAAASRKLKLMYILVVPWLLLTCTIACSPPAEKKDKKKMQYSLSGVVQGMTGNQLILELNDSEKLTLFQNGPFVFTTDLEDGGRYTVKIFSPPHQHICEVDNGVGTVGPGTTNKINVNCRQSAAGVWQLPSSLQDSLSVPGLDAREPAVSVDDNGNALVAWTQFDGSNWRVYLAEFRDNKWQAIQSQAFAISPAGGEARQPAIAMASNGDAVIAWQQKVDDRSHVYMAERRNGKWRLPASLDDHISPDKSYAWEANVAMDDAGNAIIVWDQEYAEGFHRVYKSEYRHRAWHHPSSLEDHISLPGGDGLRPRVVMNNRGEALITWEQDPEGMSRIYKSEYRQGAWFHPVDLNDRISPDNDGGGAFNAIPALNDQGGAVIAWQQAHGSSSRIYKSEYRMGAWLHPGTLEDSISPPSPTSATLNSVAINNEGNSLLIWNLQEMGSQKIYLSEFRSGDWKHPLADDFLVGSDRDFDFRVFGSTAMADNGRAVLCWLQMGDDRFGGLFLAEYEKGAWNLPGKLINIGDNSAASFVISSSPKGNFIVAWQQGDDNNEQIYCSVYTESK